MSAISSSEGPEMVGPEVSAGRLRTTSLKTALSPSTLLPAKVRRPSPDPARERDASAAPAVAGSPLWSETSGRSLALNTTDAGVAPPPALSFCPHPVRSEEHTSELQ